MCQISQLKIKLLSIPVKTKKSHLSARDGTELLTQKCVSNLPYKITVYINILPKCFLLIITPGMDQ